MSKKIDLTNLFKDVKSLVHKAEQKESKRGVTFWIPPEYKEKYDHLQSITDRKFSHKMTELFMQALDEVNL